MKFIPIVMCGIFLLAACTGTETRPAATQAQANSGLNPQPSVPDVTENALPGESDTTPPTLLPLMLVTLNDEEVQAGARLVDPLSLDDLSGYQSIGIGHHYTYALSPDGQTMALITWQSDTSLDGVLRFIDLPAWKDEATDVTFDNFVVALVFSADGKSLFWSEPTRRDASHGLPRDYVLYRYDLDSQARTEVVQFPPSFDPWEMRLVGKGSRLAIYGLPITSDNLAEDVPHVLLVDLDADKLAADLRLEGVTAWQMRVDSAGANEPTYRMYRPGLAWDLERSLLYVVHADSDRITIVDLAQSEVRRQADIRPAQSFLERLLGWLSTSAQAKGIGTPGTEKWSALDPKGNRLYIVGLHSEMEQKEASQEWDWRQVPLGLQVIATDGLAELQRLDLPVNNLSLSPDGRWLLLTGAFDMSGADGQLERVDHGLYLVDAHSLHNAGHLLPESEVYLHGFSADSRFAYVSTAASEWLSDRWGNWSVTLHLLELESGRFVAEREFPGYVLDVIR